ncbi:hypothetical protein BDR07DRAFT_1060242 [Suillus spraguei]|nr:hypothetical protein BDR07DRAFT_1060242 [Suillus spraguei]
MLGVCVAGSLRAWAAVLCPLLAAREGCGRKLANHTKNSRALEHIRIYASSMQVPSWTSITEIHLVIRSNPHLSQGRGRRAAKQDLSSLSPCKLDRQDNALGFVAISGTR